MLETRDSPSVSHLPLSHSPTLPLSTSPVALIGPVPPELGGATQGGVAAHQVQLARALAAAGVDLALLATNAPAQSPTSWRSAHRGVPLFQTYLPTGMAGWVDPRYLHAVSPGALVHYVRRLARYAGEPLGSRRVALGYLLWYRRFLRTVRPCLVHMQHPLERHLYTRLVSRFEGWRLPLVVTVHSIFKEHSDELIEKLIQPNLQHADRLIVVSRTTAAEAAQLGADPSKFRLIRTGVDLERFGPRDRLAARAQLGVSPDQPLVLFVGNLEPRKAVDRLLLALRDVRRVVQGATLAIIGTGASAGADDQEPRLRQMAAEMGLGPAVWFLGQVPGDELPAWYAAADVFALPSSSEAQGMVVLEAMASGLPVVASAVGGLLDTVEDGRTGYLVPFGDVPQLADRLHSLLVDPSLRVRMGAAAHEVAVRDFSWQNVARATIDVYREVLDESRIPYSAA